MNEALLLRERPRSFDYGKVELKTRLELQGAARRLGALARGVAADMWEMGRLLSDAQARLSAYGQGTFGVWMEREVCISRTTAWRLMRIHKTFVRSKLEQTLFASSALYLLSEPSTPQPARNEAMRRAERGETITHAKAQAIVRSFQPAPPKPEVPPVPELPPMPDLPAYRNFEREELMPRLHDAGVEDAPQMLSGQEGNPESVPQEQQERARRGLRESIVEAMAGLDTSDEEAVEAVADEVIEILGQAHNSIAIAARIALSLARGPKSLSDLTRLCVWVCGESMDGMERSAYLGWRKRTLRILDSLTFSGGCAVFEHQLVSGQLVYSLLEDPPSCP